VNDTLGHLRGDELLRQVSHCLQATVDDPESVFRVGGDEFTVLLGPDLASSAGDLARLLRAAVTPVLAPVGAGLSAGVARRRPGEPVLTTLGRADVDLYRSKGVGLGPDRDRRR
jgi:diguanylate cyclase (GGDEF)-like protein